MSSSSQVPKVYVDRSILPEGLTRLRERYHVTVHQGNKPPSRDEFLEGAKGMDALFIHPFVKVDKELLDVAGG